MNLPDDVLEKAARDVFRSCQGHDPNTDDSSCLRGYRRDVSAAAPVIADYAYRKGREDALAEARAGVQVLIADHEQHAHVMDVQYQREHDAGRYTIAQTKVRAADRERACVSSLRAALTSLAGEKGQGCPGSEDDHSCHEGCGCRTGGSPAPDFEGGDNQ